MFGNTYVCEQLFSRMNLAKKIFRASLTHEHLESTLRVATSTIPPDFHQLVQQINTSHHTRLVFHSVV